MMNSLPLHEQQQAHREAFDERTAVVTEVDLDHYEGARFGPWSPYWHVYNLVREYAGEGRRRLLCVGCGNGRDALIYAKLGFEVWAFDISVKAIEIAKNLAKVHGCEEKVHFEVMASEDLEYAAEWFDIAVGVNVLHHVNVERSMEQLANVLRKGGVAIFKEPLLTPRWNRIRNSRLLTCFVPAGTKSLRDGVRYDLVPGEKNLGEEEFETIRRHFVNLSIKNWHVLAKLSVVLGNRAFLERCDWMLFRLMPFMRRLGDQAVLTFEKS